MTVQELEQQTISEKRYGSDRWFYPTHFTAMSYTLSPEPDLSLIHIYATPEELFGYDLITSAYQRDPQESKERILKHLQSRLPNATEMQLEKIIKG